LTRIVGLAGSLWQTRSPASLPAGRLSPLTPFELIVTLLNRNLKRSWTLNFQDTWHVDTDMRGQVSRAESRASFWGPGQVLVPGQGRGWPWHWQWNNLARIPSHDTGHHYYVRNENLIKL
jgi:hypothetical protein